MLHVNYTLIKNKFIKNLKNKKNKRFYFIFIYSFSNILILYVGLSFWPTPFSFFLKNFLWHFFQDRSNWQQIPSVFVFISSSLLKNNFTEYRILVSWVLSLNTINTPLLLLAWSLKRNSIKSLLLCLYR